MRNHFIAVLGSKEHRALFPGLPTLALRISPPEVSVCNTEDEAVKDDSDDDWQDDGHPNFHMWPDPVTPFLVLKLK